VTTLAYAAAITKRLHLGIAVLIINQRNPVDLAKALSSVDVLSNGRLIVGVGLGHSTKYYPAYGLASEGRVARFRENLAIMKRLWTEERVTLDGRFSHLERIPMEPKPIQKPHPPIWFGGRADAVFQRAIELGDGYIGAGSTSIRNFLDESKTFHHSFLKRSGCMWLWAMNCRDCGNGLRRFTVNRIWQSRWPYGDLQTESRSR